MTSSELVVRRSFAHRGLGPDPSRDRPRYPASEGGGGALPLRPMDALPESDPNLERFELALFGGPEIRRRSGAIPLSPLQGAFLGVLAAHGSRGVAHHVLLDLLWDAGTDDRLRGRLNQLVYALHGRLGGERVILRAGSNYRLDLGRVTSDLEGFFGALRDRDALGAAAIVGRGFLAGLGPPPTAALERWVRERDLRLRGEVRELAWALWAEAEQRGDWALAEAASGTLLELSPDSEEVLRKVLQSKALQGKVQEASVTWDGYREVARLRKPEWSPQDETVALLDRLEELAARGRETVTVQAGSGTPEPPFVGRQLELRRLTGLIRDPLPDAVTLVLVGAEAGVGKTRLVREALSRAPMEGVRVLVTSCSDFEAGIPMGALLRALTPSWIGPEVRGLEDPWRSLLLTLLPEFQGEGPPPGPYPGPPEAVQRVTCEAFRQLLRSLASEDPVVLFIDDVQWVDPTSLAVLEYLVEGWDAGELVLLLAVRPEVLGDGSSPARWLARRSERGDWAEHLILPPLADDEVRELVRATSGAGSIGRTTVLKPPSQVPDPDAASDRHPRPGPAELEEVVALSGGHPLLAIEYARHLAHRGRPGEGRLLGGPLPEVLGRLLRDRVTDLGARARGLLAALAPSDHPLPLPVAEEVSSATGSEFAAALDEGVRAGLLALSPRGVEFRHGLFREALLQELPEGRKARAHAAIAEALIGLGDPSLEMDIALHLLRSGDGRRARPFVLGAARRAIDSGGWTEAREVVLAALASDPPNREKALLSGLLGRVYFLSGSFALAAQAWEAARLAHQGAGEEREALAARLRMLEARALDPASDREGLLGQVRALRTEVAERHHVELVADAMEVEIQLLDRLERIPEVRGLTEEASSRSARGAHHDELHFLVVSLVGAVYGNADHAMEVADRALALAREQGRPDLALKVVNWKVIALYQQARLNLPEGEAVIREGLEMLRSSSDIKQRYQLEANLAVWQMDVGNYDAAVRGFDRAERVLGQLKAPHLRRTLLGNRGQLALELGDPDRAMDQFQRSLSDGEVASWGAHQRMALAGVGLVHFHQGRLAEARSMWQRLPPPPEAWTFDPYLCLALEARLGLANGEPAQVVCSRLSEHEANLRSTVATAWMRVRMLRFELGLRRGVGPVADDIEELTDFFERRGIPSRLKELKSLLRRYS